MDVLFLLVPLRFALQIARLRRDLKAGGNRRRVAGGGRSEPVSRKRRNLQQLEAANCNAATVFTRLRFPLQTSPSLRATENFAPFSSTQSKPSLFWRKFAAQIYPAGELKSKGKQALRRQRQKKQAYSGFPYTCYSGRLARMRPFLEAPDGLRKIFLMEQGRVEPQ